MAASSRLAELAPVLREFAGAAEILEEHIARIEDENARLAKENGDLLDTIADLQAQVVIGPFEWLRVVPNDDDGSAGAEVIPLASALGLSIAVLDKARELSIAPAAARALLVWVAGLSEADRRVLVRAVNVQERSASR